MILATTNDIKDAKRRLKSIKSAVDDPSDVKVFAFGGLMDEMGVPLFPRYPGFEVVDISNKHISVICDGDQIKAMPSLYFQDRKSFSITIHYK